MFNAKSKIIFVACLLISYFSMIKAFSQNEKVYLTNSKEISVFENIEVLGLMTMGPFVEDGESLRPYFRKAKKLSRISRICEYFECFLIKNLNLFVIFGHSSHS